MLANPKIEFESNKKSMLIKIYREYLKIIKNILTF